MKTRDLLKTAVISAAVCLYALGGSLILWQHFENDTAAQEQSSYFVMADNMWNGSKSAPNYGDLKKMMWELTENSRDTLAVLFGAHICVEHSYSIQASVKHER